MPCREASYMDPRSTLESQFNNIKLIGSSCSGYVLSAVEKGDKQQKYALKKLSIKRKSHCRAAVREIRVLKRLRHENIVKTSSVRAPNGCEIKDINEDAFQNLDFVYLAEELMDTDLHKILDRSGKLEEKTSKLFLYQTLRGLKFIHSANSIHRDIKPGNLFVNVDDLTLKVGDFGLARVVDPKFDHVGHLTELVSTRYYRAPEVILSPGNYNSSVDIWSSGCVFAEMCTGDVLFPGENDLQQIDCIRSSFHESGRFMANKLTGMSQAGLDFLQKMLRLDPAKRLTASQLLEDPYFGDISDPNDEPVCPKSHVFHVEHEVDDLPLQTLRNMCLKECCPDDYTTQDLHSDLFQGFDEEFSFEMSTMDETPFQDTSSGESNDSCSFSSVDNSCPSLLNILSSTIVDEPYRDPACSEARTDAFLESVSAQSDCSTSGHCSPNFPKVSSFLDVSRCVDAPPSDPRRPFETTVSPMNLKNIPRSFLASSGLEKEMLRKLSEHSAHSGKNCGLSQFAVSEHLRHGQFSHWDTIRIWI